MNLTNSPLTADQQHLMKELTGSLNTTQSTWLAGFFTALSCSDNEGSSSTVSVAASNVLVLFGTESGNCEMLAAKTVKALKKQGSKTTLKNMSEITPRDLAKFDTILCLVSTWGEGDPPETAESFYKAFLSTKTDLTGKFYSICALGDTSYEQFCEIGKKMDAKFKELGATALTERVDCDVDFDDNYAAWAKATFDNMSTVAQSTDTADQVIVEEAPAIEYGRKNPFPSEVLENLLLNGEGSSKETIHVELDLEGSGLNYEAGDALAVVPVNPKDIVDDILKATAFDSQAKVTVKGLEETTLKTALTEQLDITAVAKSIIKKYNAFAKSDELTRLIGADAKAELKDWLWGRQIVDLLELYPAADLTPQDFVSVLRKLPPRLYSIASSPKAHPGEVHLTVAAVRYNAHGKDRKGIASTYLADEAKTGEKVAVYVHQNKNFRLPESEETPVIMVGPGTGIAPFRAFIEDRGESGNKGGSWLFFGDQKYTFDFLYQLELQDHLESGSLTKLDVAFSRDQPEKVYVQDKMREQAVELYQWLEKGAHFYVCGDASRMASDVHDALIEIVQTQGNKSEDEAKAYVDQLKKDKRYQRDVY